VAASLGGLAESNLAMLASMLSMVFSREHTPRPASSSTFFTVFRREETLATITCVCVCVGGGGGGGGGWFFLRGGCDDEDIKISKEKNEKSLY